MEQSREEVTTRGGGKLVTARWLAKNRFCGVTPKTIRFWASHGAFPAPLVTTRKLHFWSLASVDAWVAANSLSDEAAAKFRAAEPKLREAIAAGDAEAADKVVAALAGEAIDQGETSRGATHA